MTEVEEDTKTEFSFDELDERAKQKAREAYTSGDYPGYEWWDSTYEDAVRMAEMIGISISTTTQRGRLGKTYQTTDIQFSGFSSQGDGASFEGEYRHAPDAVEKIKAECNDKELLRIASELTVLQLTRRLKGLEFFSATITTRGNYSHSGTMNATIREEEYGEGYENTDDDLENTVQQLMRDFADWIYKQLEAEYDYLTSDEYVDERLAEESFDEDGEIV